MIRTLMKSKIHRATVTEANLLYEGSISIGPELMKAADFALNEKVDIYNCNNGQRLSTYVIEGSKGDICLNGAAARLVQPGDLVIIVSYAQYDQSEVKKHQPKVVFVNDQNKVTEQKNKEQHRRLAKK